MDEQLSIQHETFCQLVVKYKFRGAQRRAYKEVYCLPGEQMSDSVADSAASRLFSDVKIKNRVAEIYKEFQDSVSVSKEDVINGLSKLAFADIRDAFTADGRLKPLNEIPDDIASALAGVEVFEESIKCDGMVTPIGETKKIKMAGKVEAFRLMCDMLGYKAAQKVETELSVNWNESKNYPDSGKE